MASDLNDMPDSVEGIQISRAYDSLAMDVIPDSFRDRDIEYLWGSAKALSYADTPCPLEGGSLFRKFQHCITVVGSFHVLVGPGERDPQTLATHVYFTIQNFIDAGDLQCHLEHVEEWRQVEIISGGGCGDRRK